MKVVVDTNIVFSAILNTDGKIGNLLLTSQGTFEFYSAEYLRIEIGRYDDKLRSLSGLTEEQLGEAKYHIFNKISFLSEVQIPGEIWHASVPLVKEVDMDDIAFVAMSKYLQTILWTGDKKLQKGLIKKGFTSVMNTQQLLDLRQKIETDM
jgi:predicted nucleic acid-binding protein